jgi:hypothetical protein
VPGLTRLERPPVRTQSLCESQEEEGSPTSVLAAPRAGAGGSGGRFSKNNSGGGSSSLVPSAAASGSGYGSLASSADRGDGSLSPNTKVPIPYLRHIFS